MLTQIINYGAPLFGIALLLGALGIPVHASLILIAVGTFAQDQYFSWVTMALFGLAGTLIGDALSFGMGYYGKDWVKKKFGNSRAWSNASDYFQRRAWVAIFLTRFLVTTLAIPTNLIAGGSGYKFSRFMLYDALGEIVWIILYGGLGYLFSNQWELAGEFISNFGGVILGIVLLGIGIRLGLRWFANHNSANSKIPEA